MKRNDYVLFSQGELAGLSIKNRLVRSATYEGGMTEDGRVTPTILNLYKNLAAGGAGMVITGHMAVRPEGKGHSHQISVYDDAHIPEIAKIAETVHASGENCHVIGQVTYAGRQVLHHNSLAECVGPSAVPSPVLKKMARELKDDEIKTIVTCFAEGVERVKKAGFDGVQLHGAHGYLLSSFISPYTNKRNDTYGGSLENRTAILKDIITESRKRVGDFPILIKINCTDHMEGGIDGASFPDVAKQVESLGFDAIEVSGGIWDCMSRSKDELGFPPVPIPEARTRINSAEKQSYYAPAAEALDLGIPVISVGGHRNVENLETIVKRGKIDFISMSRPLICEPDLPNRWREGRGNDKTFCVSCNSCLLEIGSKPLKCIRKQSKVKQKVIQNFTPYVWKMVMK